MEKRKEGRGGIGKAQGVKERINRRSADLGKLTVCGGV